MSTFFVKRTDAAIVVASHKFENNTYKVKGKTFSGRKQIKDLKLGFFVPLEKEVLNELDLKPGDELPFSITDKPVLDMEGKPLRNLFWAE